MEQQSKVVHSRGPTIRKSPPLSVQQFRVQLAILYLDTLIANINSRFSGEVLSLLSQPQYSTQLFFLMMSLRALITLRCQPWLPLEKAEGTFEGVTYSSLAIVNKEELLGEGQILRAVFQEKVMIGGGQDYAVTCQTVV